jgi:hypothetical protein
MKRNNVEIKKGLPIIEISRILIRFELIKEECFAILNFSIPSVLIM